jgi:hypothetical protein
MRQRNTSEPARVSAEIVVGVVTCFAASAELLAQRRR